MTSWKNDQLTQWQANKMIMQKNHPLTSAVDETRSWQNDHLTKWPVDQTTLQLNGQLTQQPVDKMMNWQNGKSTKWQVDTMALRQSINPITETQLNLEAW